MVFWWYRFWYKRRLYHPDAPFIDSTNKTITISGTPTSQISADTQKIFTIETLGSGGL